MDDPHANGTPCHVCRRLRALHVADVAVALDALTVREQRSLAQHAGVPAEGGLAARLTERFHDADADAAHDVARRLLRPLIASADRALRDPCLDLRLLVAWLVADWPPALVVVFVELAWEAGELPPEALDRDALERLDPGVS